MGLRALPQCGILRFTVLSIRAAASREKLPGRYGGLGTSVRRGSGCGRGCNSPASRESMKGLCVSATDAVVILATIGKPTLSRAIDSILSQSHGDVTALVVVDGPQFGEAAGRVLARYASEPRVQRLVLPQNTGANGFVCHRIYGAMPLLVNQAYVLYCDDDNWFEPTHVATCVRACEEMGWEWCFSLRNIYKDDTLVCRDECESVGLWPV